MTNRVVAVVAHRDCDEIEPAHTRNTAELLDDMRKARVPQPVAVTPAYELRHGGTSGPRRFERFGDVGGPSTRPVGMLA